MADSNMLAFARYIEHKENISLSGFDSMVDYHKLHHFSIADTDRFWRHIWDYFQVRGAQRSGGAFYQQDFKAKDWFAGSTLNYAEHLLQRRDSATAITAIKEDGRTTTLSYQELYALVARCARGLQRCGVGVGDRVCACVANSPESLVIMLACSAIGAIFASASPDFGAPALIDRFSQIRPKLLFAVDGYSYAGKQISIQDKIAELKQNLPELAECVVIPFLDNDAKPNWPDCAVWEDWLAPPGCTIDFVQLPFSAPLYILFSSGTTGQPKCIVHRAGGVLLKHLCELGLHCEVDAQSKMFYFTTCGWMMWNWMASALALGAQLVVYDGSPMHPSPDRLLQIVDYEGVSHFGAGARYYSELANVDLDIKQHYRLEALQSVFSTGSVLPPAVYDYIYQRVKADVHLASISGGTDLVGLLLGCCVLLPVVRGQLQCPALAMDCAVFDQHDQSVHEQEGELVCLQSFPTVPVGFWDDADGGKFDKAYFAKYPGIWAHGDYVVRHQSGAYSILGRSDTTLNPGGVRIGSAEIYRQLATIAAVREAAAVGWRHNSDEQIVLFVLLAEGQELDEQLSEQIKNRLRANASPRHVPKLIISAPDIPRTMSGKIAEQAIANSINGRLVDNSNALANPEALTFFRELQLSEQQPKKQQKSKK